jgi:hypothetical protein
VTANCTLGGTSVIGWPNYVTGSLQPEYTAKPYLHETDRRVAEIDAPILTVRHRAGRGTLTLATPRRVPKGWHLDEVDLWSQTHGRRRMVSLYPIHLCTRPTAPKPKPKPKAKPPVPTISLAVANDTLIAQPDATTDGAVRTDGLPSGSPIGVSYACSTSISGCVGTAPGNTTLGTAATATFAKVLPVATVPATATAGTANVTLTINSRDTALNFDTAPISGVCTIEADTQQTTPVVYFCAINTAATITVTSAFLPK